MMFELSTVVGLLTCLTASWAVPTRPIQFPHGKTVIYKYYADVKAGTLEPVPYASQFAIDGLLHIKHEDSDPTLNNAYYVALKNVKHGLYNGESNYNRHVNIFHPISEAARMIEDPFLVIFDNHGKIEGLKMTENESGWSRNMKQAIASMLQLDLSSMELQSPINPHSFITTENTIHGKCTVAYNVHPKYPVQHEDSNVFVVTKNHELMNCTGFVQRIFDPVDVAPCFADIEDSMTTVARRMYEVENHGNAILIKKLVGHSTINYLPWQAKSEAHYLLTNLTLVLENVVPVVDVTLPAVNFEILPIVKDISFKKPQGNYALHAGEDLTQGRHIVKLDVLMPKLKKMLGEAADYLEENHLEMKEPEFKHGQTINRLLHTMTYMDFGSLEQVFLVIREGTTPREVTIRNVFLYLMPYVGTTASCVFVRHVIREHMVPDMTAIIMLSTLPFHVRAPSENLLLEMESLIHFSDAISLEIRKASILCFATLINKTFKDQHSQVINPLLDRYVQYFFDHVKSESTFEMKMVYLWAMQNVAIGNVHVLLAPIIRGDLVISEKPYYIRFLAMIASRTATERDINTVHDLYWPILVNVELPIELRMLAYDTLMSQPPDMGRMMNIQWFMLTEKNKHLYNYHYTTLKSLANSVDPCMQPIREMARKVIRFTKIRSDSENFLSANYIVGYEDTKFSHGETWNAKIFFNESTGTPDVGYVEYFSSTMRKTVSNIALHWKIEGMEDVAAMLFPASFAHEPPISNEVVRNLLAAAAKDMPSIQNIHITLCFLLHGRAILIKHYNKDTVDQIFLDIDIFNSTASERHFNLQHVAYNHLYEMHVPTDLGLPAVLATRIPQVTSLKINAKERSRETEYMFKLDVDARIWRHGTYSMTVYNPVADVWHTIQRVHANDIAIPILMDARINSLNKGVKMTFPRLPLTKHSTLGVLMYTKSYVTVSEDETDTLKKHCATCRHHDVVTKGISYKKYHQSIYESKDTGLLFSSSIFDCESNVSPATRMKDWMSILVDIQKTTWVDTCIYGVMALRQQFVNDFISPQIGTCGSLLKMEPSIAHATSRVDVNMRINSEEIDLSQKPLQELKGQKINIRGTVDVKAASTNTSVRIWDMNANIDMSEGHIDNEMTIRITRKTPGEKDLKICIDAQKIYPVIESDPLKLGTTKEEVNGKITFSMGQTDEEKCIRDDTVISVTMKSELSDEQKELYKFTSVYGKCKGEMQHPLYQNSKNFIPRTYNCMQDVIRDSTLRKYIVNLAYKKVPQNIMTLAHTIEDTLRVLWFPYLRYQPTYLEAGNIKVAVEYPIDRRVIDVSVATPVYNYEYVALPFHDSNLNALLDNTHFSMPFLWKYAYGLTKMCSVYPRIVINADNGTILHEITSTWILMSGDYVKQQYAIFLKKVDSDNIAMKMYVADHVIEVLPIETNVAITVDGNTVDQYVNGFVVPSDSDNTKAYTFRVTWNNGRLSISSERVPVWVEYTASHVTLLLDKTFQGRITGACGHMDDMHKETLPKIYSIINI